jgi:hypothetical protein
LSVAKFRKKPVVVEAIQWSGPPDDAALAAFAGHWASIGAEVYLTTPEGAMRVSPGDWVIRGVKGEFYPCKPDIFAATYEPAEG